jgi:hypothetical protein
MHVRATSQPASLAEWVRAGTVATVRAADTTARLDLTAPDAGLAIAAEDRVDHLLGIDLHAAAGAPVDDWVRGGDLIAVYEPDDARRLRATAMWRVRPAAVAAWELVISAQTALLHADAALAVVSEVAGTDVRWTAADARWMPPGESRPLPAEAVAVLVRRAATAALVAVHPQDPRRVVVTSDGGRVRIECGIFPAAIEKGVILRSRVLAAVGAARGAESWAGDICKAFAASPPFLDT